MKRLADKIPFSIKMNLLNIYNKVNRFRIYIYRLDYPGKNEKWNPIPLKLFEKYNRVRNFGPKKRFCYAPWTNLFFNTYGSALVCCYNTKITLGKYPEKSLHDMWFSPARKDFAEYLMKNDLRNGCQFCHYQIGSGRFENLKPSTVDRYANTKFSRYPAVVEFELSNTCNLECVMCSGRVSSSIRKNRDQEPPLPNLYDDAFVDQLEEFIPHIREAKFFGGEPFLIDIYYKIWNRIKKLNPDCQIFLLTNGTVYNDKVERTLSNMNISLGISLDAMDKALYESIRKNAVYENVMNNIHKFAEYCKRNGKILGFSITPMTLNWQEMPRIVEFANSLGAIVYFSFVEKPERYALWTLGKESLTKIMDHYRTFDFPQRTSIEKINWLRFGEIIRQIGFWVESGIKPSLSVFPDPHSENEEKTFTPATSKDMALHIIREGLDRFFSNKYDDAVKSAAEADTIYNKIAGVTFMEKEEANQLALLNKILSIGITEALVDEIGHSSPESLYNNAKYFLLENGKDQ